MIPKNVSFTTGMAKKGCAALAWSQALAAQGLHRWMKLSAPLWMLLEVEAAVESPFSIPSLAVWAEGQPKLPAGKGQVKRPQCASPLKKRLKALKKSFSSQDTSL